MPKSVKATLAESPQTAFWAFREELKEHDLVDELFTTFNQALLGEGIELKSGQIIDATFIPVPIQRNTKEENASIKAGNTPAEWSKEDGKEDSKEDSKVANKLAQKDVDAGSPAKSADYCSVGSAGHQLSLCRSLYSR